MKKLNNIYLRYNNTTIAFTTTIVVFFTDSPVYAQALGQAKKALGALQTDLISNIIPIAAAVILLCLAIGYAGRYIGKDTFVRWAIGVVIAGSASELVKMLFG
ncbi:VirB2 family type IV secretion system major pilin TrwL [Bartonella taylorii]|uniref:VirB2 family type IV secretion system major pilin TrwL n=1 Tax=Bartonella taylorii TaxID=33046 RepID=UPI001ABA62D7|nr:VirB2 family type IV secretion system major pilin TrwL [Bartonella taylorii]